MPAISTAIGLGLAAGSAISGAIGKKKAANAQQKGAEQAQALQASNQQKAIDFQKAQTAKEEAAQQPYAAAGGQGLNSLREQLATPGEGLLKGYSDFTAPDPNDVANTPEYKFALEQGTHALDSSAAAKGNLFSGTQGTALQQYGQGLASNQYQQAYQDALSSYNTNFNTFNTGQTNQYNRLRDLAGIGQHAADVTTGVEQSAANNVGDVLVSGANAQAQSINNAAAARASGYRGVGDEIANGLTYGGNWMQEAGAQDAYNQRTAVMRQQQQPADAAQWLRQPWNPAAPA